MNKVWVLYNKKLGQFPHRVLKSGKRRWYSEKEVVYKDIPQKIYPQIGHAKNAKAYHYKEDDDIIVVAFELKEVSQAELV